jgi:hypothetical protein
MWMCCHLTYHLLFVPLPDSVWAKLRLIPLAILAPSNGRSWLVDREWSDLLVVGG